MGTIRVRVERESAEGEGAGEGPAGAGVDEIKEIFGGGASAVVPFDTAELAASLRRLTSQLGELFGDLRAVGGYELQQVQVGLEISAEGGINLIGSAKAGGKGAITMTFAPGQGARVTAGDRSNPDP